MTLITLRNLGVTLSAPLFSRLNLVVNAGDRIGLVAANGRGKSTLLRCIAGAMEASEGEITRSRGLTIGYVEQNVPEALLDRPFYAAVLEALRRPAAPAMQRSKVDLPRPLAATSPIRSAALTTRFSRENSGAFSVTPRLRSVMSVMIVLWSCRPITTSRARGNNRMSVSQRSGSENAGANAQGARRPHGPKGRPGTGFVRCLRSALQTHLQGIDRAKLNAGRSSSWRGPFPIEWDK